MPGIEALKLGASALTAYRAAIETIGHNIANVATPGYSRQRVLFSARTPSHQTFGDVGRGVDVSMVERLASDFLDAQLRVAGGESERWGLLERTYRALEAFLNETGGASLGNTVSRFFATMNDIASDVENLPARQQLIEQALALKDVFRNIMARIDDMWRRLDFEITQQVERINRLTAEIADLNERIAEAEAGGAGRSVANDLRDKRGQLLADLAKLLSVSIQEDERGAVSVTAGGRPLVFLGQKYGVTAVRSGTNGGYRLAFAEDGAEVTVSGGQIGGIYEARDEVLARYGRWFNDYAASLIWQINRLHSTGAGLEARTTMQGTNGVVDATKPFSSLEFDFAPHDGVFAVSGGRLTVNVVESATGLIHRYTINYDVTEPLAGSASGLIERLDALSGISVRLDSQNRVVIQSDTGYGFFFSEDTGGVLATLGLGGLLSGHDARSIDVSGDMVDRPEFIASNRTLLPGDNSLILELAALNTKGTFLNTSLFLDEAYRAMIGGLGTDSLSVQEARANQSDILMSLENERQEISGVSLDEELAELIQYQKAYQGIAKFISVADELLDTLIKM